MLEGLNYQDILKFLESQTSFNTTNNIYGITHRFFFEKDNTLIYFNETEKRITFFKSKKSAHSKNTLKHRTSGPAILFESGEVVYVVNETELKHEDFLQHPLVKKNEIKNKLSKL